MRHEFSMGIRNKQGSNPHQKDNNFEYLLSDKNSFLVVTFVGSIDIQAVEKLARLQDAIALNKNAKFVILNFRDVSGISREVFPQIIQIQKAIREKPAELKICGFSSELRERIANTGIIRSLEMAANLQEAIQSLGQKKRG